MHSRNIRSTLTLALLVLAAASLSYWILQSRVHTYPDAPAGKFACLSYTPRDGTSDDGADIRAQIDSDLQQLAKRTNCVRTYSVLNGLDYVPTAARKLGMRVLLGIWISRTSEINEQEITKGIAIANANRDVIDAIIVGNEVLLRREQDADALSDMLRRVHTATQLPVTYADVWDFWLKNPKMAAACDFITIHILPYWEDEPVAIGQAMAHVETIYQKTQQTFPGKRIFVGEVGWPSAGRQREASQPSLLNQARFTREFIALANRLNLNYNFIEAYDQTWKKGLEGTVGGYWGLYDAQGHEKFPLIGSMVADTHWWRGPLAGGIAGLLLLVLARSATGVRAAWSQLNFILAGISIGCLGVMQWDYLWQSNRNWQEWLAMSSLWLLTYAIGLLALFDWQSRWPKVWNGLLLALMLGLAYINLGLIFEGRYRDFISTFLLLPIILLAIKGTLDAPIMRSNEGLLLSIWLAASPFFIACVEGLHNLSALFWCALCVLLGLRLLFDSRFIGTRIVHQ